MESQSERIVGDETLGMEPQTFDPDVASYGTNSIPPIMSAQMELMTTTRILQPFAKNVLRRLQNLIQTNELRSWFVIYLSLFVLLHSCSILTADENMQARKYGLQVRDVLRAAHNIHLAEMAVWSESADKRLFQTRYLVDAFIEELHTGAKTMIYYFHYCNKGSHPFAATWMTEENLALADLNKEQECFLKESSILIRERCEYTFELEAIRESSNTC